MIEAPLPPDEVERLETLRQLNILYTPAEDRFDRITRLACSTLDVPIALVSLVAESCQWFKSAHGLEAAETPRAVSFCSHAILSDKPLVVPDATKDERFADNPLVADAPHVRFYAGFPVHADNGAKLGTLCVIDTQPRTFTAEQLGTLEDLAGWVSNELRLTALSRSQLQLIAEHRELQRSSLIDSLTTVWNRKAILEVLEREATRAAREEADICVLMLDIDRFKQVNDRYGHPAGDRVLREVAKNIRRSIRPYDAVGRMGGEEFLVALIRCTENSAVATAERLRLRVAAALYQEGETEFSVSVSGGLVNWNPGTSGMSRDDVIAEADRALYRAKSAGRDRIEIGSLQAERF